MNDLRYPIGQIYIQRPITEEMIDTWIQEIEDLPNELTKSYQRFRSEAVRHTVPRWWMDSSSSSPSRC